MIGKRLDNAWWKFRQDVQAFALETEGDKDAEVTLYEDAFTTRHVRDFYMTETGFLSWKEDGKTIVEYMQDEDDAREWLKFWRANLRKAKRYWEMDTEKLDAIHDGEIEDED